METRTAHQVGGGYALIAAEGVALRHQVAAQAGESSGSVVWFPGRSR
jgi:hypothetical protein